jgi:hypothetical protein
MRALIGILMLCLLGGCVTLPVPEDETKRSRPFMAQVVAVQWLNPLQRRDYPTQWQLLWTLGLVQPNPGDDMVKANPGKYSSLQAISPVAAGNEGEETFRGYHRNMFVKS